LIGGGRTPPPLGYALGNTCIKLVLLSDVKKGGRERILFSFLFMKLREFSNYFISIMPMLNCFDPEFGMVHAENEKLFVVFFI